MCQATQETCAIVKTDAFSGSLEIYMARGSFPRYHLGFIIDHLIIVKLYNIIVFHRILILSHVFLQAFTFALLFRTALCPMGFELVGSM